MAAQAPKRKQRQERVPDDRGPSDRPGMGSLLSTLRKLELGFRESTYNNLARTAEALRLEKISSAWLIALALTVFAGSTAIAYRQFRTPYTWHEERTPFWELGWWTHPLEWNVDAGLSNVAGDITSLALQPSASHSTILSIKRPIPTSASAAQAKDWLQRYRAANHLQFNAFGR